MAIQYGMSMAEFWHEDTRYFEVCAKAYARDKSYTAWLNGRYNWLAHQIALGNALRDKNQKVQNYPDYQDPFPYEGDKITADNIEGKHRNLGKENIDWINEMCGFQNGA